MRRFSDSKVRVMLVGLVVGFSFAFCSSVLADESEGMQPIADAGLPRYAAQASVVLDGTGSFDPDNSGLLLYTWRQISGQSVDITGENTARPTISGFVQTDEIQECEFELVVSDGELTSSPDKVKVVIVPTFSNCTMTLESGFFDPEKPTIVYFGGGVSEQTGGARLNRPLWSEKANVISFPAYVADPGSFSGAQTDRSYKRPGDMVIVYLSSVAPDYSEPIQTLGFSIGGLLALDVSLRMNVTYADARYAVNHACLLDPSAWVLGTPEFHRRVALLLNNPVAGERCWVASYEAANVSVCPSALNVVFEPDHTLPFNWYLRSLEFENEPFNHGMVAGAYWSVVGPGRNLQVAVTPGVQTYKLRWHGNEFYGYMGMYDESAHSGRLPEPVTLIGPMGSGDAEGVILTSGKSENAIGYRLLLGADPHRIVDYTIVSDTPAPPTEPITTFPFEQTWWTVQARDRHGSTIYAEPRLIDDFVLSLPVENMNTGQRYGYIQDAINQASPGDEIVLSEGTYYENILFRGRNIILRSTDPNDASVVANTVVESSGQNPVVAMVSGRNVGCTLAGLTIRGGRPGISCRGACPIIRNCVIDNDGPNAVEYWYNCEPVIINCNIPGLVTMADVDDPTIIAIWALNEADGDVASDTMGWEDGVVHGEPVWHPTDGMVGGALELDGVDDYVSTPYVINPVAELFSVFVWVKGGAAGQTVISQANSQDWLSADASGGVLASGLISGRGATPLVSDTVITDGEWHKIGVSWNGTNKVLYVDGVEVATDTLVGVGNSVDGLYIGAGSRLESGSFWSGLIDDVRVYNRAVVP